MASEGQCPAGQFGFKYRLAMPLGAVLGTAKVTEFHQTQLIAPSLKRRELAFGDYAFGRWAWDLDDVEMLLEPIPAQGRQGIWNWMPPT